LIEIGDRKAQAVPNGYVSHESCLLIGPEQDADCTDGEQYG
jgi:hypothetical protein